MPLLPLLLPLLLALPLGAESELDFGRDIRPLLSDRCFRCHGPDQAAVRGGFRLDLREEALASRDGRRAIVPGEAEASELLARVRHTDPTRRMPPPDAKLTLSEEEIRTLERWIEEGAPYTEHWAFIPPSRTAPPPVEREDWIRDSLDRHVLARIEAAGLAPAPEASRAAWLRRASYDLTGLPPTPAELDAFERATGEDAHARELERLFASPRHAERMTSLWLDAARYADTFGYQSDVERPVWPWRDWVIASFARNQPYDEFLHWQLAGDLLPDATEESRLATAFNRLHRMTNEGGSTEEEYRVESVADRVQTLGTAVLGLTLECARCHDHKFDPLSQREFYGLFAYFDDIDEAGLYSHFTNATPTPALDLPTEAQRDELARREAEVAAAEARVAQLVAEAARERGTDAPTAAAPILDFTTDLQAEFSFDELEANAFANKAAPDKPALLRGPARLVSGASGMAHEFTGDDPIQLPGLGHFRRSAPFTIHLRLWLPRHYERAVVLHRARAWTDSGSRGYELLIEDGCASAALIHFWPGDALRVRTREPLPLECWLELTISWDGSSRASGLGLYVDGSPVESEVVRDGLRRTILGGGIEHLTLGERFRDNGFAGGRIDALSLFARELTAAEVAALVKGETEATDVAARENEIRTTDGAFRDALEALRVARAARDAARDAPRQIMTMRELPEPRVAHLYERGDYREPREAVEPHTPAALSPWPVNAPSNRLGLARWLTAPEHPLTARVEVNRLWQLAFGSGLVDTPEDFGNQGTPPSHPELLDELALDLVASGWDRRALLERLFLSATYRQSSRTDPRARVLDPENRLLSHATRRPLTAEMLRDGALFASGLLVERIGGPPVKPYQPAGLWREKSGRTYVPDGGDGLWRRSLYTFWKRTSPPPAMMILDAAKRDVCVVRRQATGSPLQALVLWNDPQWVEAARELAARSLREGGESDEERLDFLFRSLASRAPRALELRALRELLSAERAAFRAEPERAAALVAVGTRTRDESLDAVEHASWTIVAQTVTSFDASTSLP